MRGPFGGFLDLLFPPRCLRCALPLPEAGGGELCRPCLRGMPLPSATDCPGCGRTEVEHGLDFCRTCRGTFHRDGLLTALPYEGAPRDLVHAFKYRGDFRAGRYLAGRLAARACEGVPGGCEVIVPVPLHRRRLRARGFNQASYLARGVSRNTGWPVEERVLRRQSDTRPLAGLDRRRRRREMGGAMGIRRPRAVEGRKVLVVDDVFTTGATAEECCRILKSAGAALAVFAAAARA